jgi:sialate O-acetylesterase
MEKIMVLSDPIPAISFKYAKSIMLISFFLIGITVIADVKLPSVVNSKMVLQQGIPLPIWGKADPGEKVTVAFDGQVKDTVAGADGKWMVKLDALKAKAGQSGKSMTIKGKNTIKLDNILIGEVWICSGQSNMQFPLGGVDNKIKEIAEAKYPNIRLFTVKNVTAVKPQDDCVGDWSVCTPETARDFSAVGYFFGRYVYQSLNVPVGLIDTSWGGTVAEAWTSEEALRKNLPEFNQALDENGATTEKIKQRLTEYKIKLDEYKVAFPKLYELEGDLKKAAAFAKPDLNDDSWKKMSLPGNWEARGLKDLDGIVWFRKTIEIPAAWAGKDIILRPGPIDEVDVAWFNGEKVGASGCIKTADTSFWNVPRKYQVPGKLVKAGKNIVAIRVIDACGQGGLWGDSANKMYAELADGSDKTKISLAGDWRYLVEYKLPVRPQNPNNPNLPAVLFNAMINPLVPFGIRGAIWYQGESNSGRAVQYRTLLPTMIKDWRTRWNEGDFPFLIVQLANFMARKSHPEESSWAMLREAQTMTMSKLPAVGMAVTIDIGDAKDIHPRNKQDVGKRLGMAADSIAYKKDTPSSGPLFDKMNIVGNKVELSFLHIDKGLKVKGDKLKGFAVCGADGKFVWADAEVKDDKVIVWSDKVAKPVSVRYAWANNPECNLYNGADLPAVPFRTDDKDK